MASLGAIDIYQKSPPILYVGTGEGNPCNSEAAGKGVYQSLNGGRTWQHLGLENRAAFTAVLAQYNEAAGTHFTADPEFSGEKLPTARSSAVSPPEEEGEAASNDDAEAEREDRPAEVTRQFINAEGDTIRMLKGPAEPGLDRMCGTCAAKACAEGFSRVRSPLLPCSPAPLSIFSSTCEVPSCAPLPAFSPPSLPSCCRCRSWPPARRPRKKRPPWTPPSSKGWNTA